MWRKTQRLIKTAFLFLLMPCLLLGAVTSCAPPPPQHIENICQIFQEYPSWYWSAKEVEKQWGLPVSVLMAIIYQESHFRADAAPPRQKILWIVPWKRPTSAYGYSQAINGTWEGYKNDTNHRWCSRDDFANSADFIGWFTHQAHVKAGISMHNAYALYLAYHEGIGGYERRTYEEKPWLIFVAHSVQRRATIYHSQLVQCEASLPKKPWWQHW